MHYEKFIFSIDFFVGKALINLKYNMKGIMFEQLNFINNVAAEAISIQTSVYVDMKSVTFSKNNYRALQSADFRSFAGPCFYLANLWYRNFDKLNILDAVSYIKVPGMLFLDDDVKIF